MQIEGAKLIFVMNSSVLDFFKFASRMRQIAQILDSTFKIFRLGMHSNIPRNFLFFFISNSKLWCGDCITDICIAMPGRSSVVHPTARRG